MKKLNKQNVINVVAIILIAAWLSFVAYAVMNIDSIIQQNEQTAAIVNGMAGLIAAEPLKAVLVVAAYCTTMGAGLTFVVLEAAKQQN